MPKAKKQPKKRPTFVVYQNDSEVLVTTPKLEKAMLRFWFGPRRNPYRDKSSYARDVITDEAVSVRSKGLRAEW